MKCEACNKDLPQDHTDHTLRLDECRWAVPQYRQSHKRPTRSSPAVREPRERARAEATASMPLSRPEGELGAADEEAAEASRGSRDQEPEGDDLSEQEGGSSPSGEPRRRRTWRETGTGPEHPVDWSGFDVGRVIRSLIGTSDAAKRRILRKLHVRWWHSPSATMKRL